MIVQFADRWTVEVDEEGGVGWNPYQATMRTVDRLLAVMED